VQAPKLAKAFEEDLQITASAKPVITHDYKSEYTKSHPSTTPTRHKNEVKAFETRSNERLQPKDGEIEPVQTRGRKVDKSVEAMKMSQVL
jgi:glycerophosphoryl diester phosphodiesterase